MRIFLWGGKHIAYSARIPSFEKCTNCQFHKEQTFSVCFSKESRCSGKIWNGILYFNMGTLKRPLWVCIVLKEFQHRFKHVFLYRWKRKFFNRQTKVLLQNRDDRAVANYILYRYPEIFVLRANYNIYQNFVRMGPLVRKISSGMFRSLSSMQMTYAQSAFVYVKGVVKSKKLKTKVWETERKQV